MELTVLNPPPFREDLLGYGKMIAAGRGYIAGQIEVTSRCYQSCVGCDSWREDVSGVQRGEWTLSELQEVVIGLVGMPDFEHLTLTGGDPQAWPHLSDFLRWWERTVSCVDRRITLGFNTALTRSLSAADLQLWRRVIDDLRISLDGVDEEIYNSIRGVKIPSGKINKAGAVVYKAGTATTPDEVLDRMCALEHPGLTTNTTVFNQNIDHVPKILETLLELYGDGRLKIRKAHFLAVIGDRGLLADQFWNKWELLRTNARGLTLPTNFSENPARVREYLVSGSADDVPCYASGVSFHIKANGDVYPCCLVGGEALKTQPDFIIGNAKKQTMRQIHSKIIRSRDYENPNKPCRNICQWKQFQINLAGHRMANQVLAMP